MNKQFLRVAFASVLICIVSSIEPTGWSYAAEHQLLPYFNALTPTTLGSVQDVAFRSESRVPQKVDHDTMLVLGSHVRCLKELQAMKERLDGTTDCTASDLKKELLEISKRLAETNTAVFNLKKEMTEMSRHSAETLQLLAETNADILNMKKTLNATLVELTATKNDLMDLTAAFADLEKESERNFDGLEKANAIIEVLKTEMKTTTTDLAALKLQSANATTSLASANANSFIVTAIQQDLNAIKADVIALKATSLSDKPSSIGKIPTSCADLRELGNGKSGLYNVKSHKKIKIAYCDFTKPSTDAGFQNSIGFLDVKSSTASFYVQLGKDFSEAKFPIPFVKELLNVGGAYNRTTRKFTAPVTGKYFFTITGVVAFSATSDISYLQLALYKNGGEIGRAFTDEMSDVRKHGTISLQSTLVLTKGDQIWPMISFIAPTVYLVGHGYTHYSGFLLDEDIM